ncbi:MAG: glutamine-hydrolyzing GMP synthase [Anaerolineae bacterium]|nr:glutamine-hydrolyzing GMP synthase [Anaerolineae bacterium]MDW8173547.1 glutamine-hydrolyzing GMP synthase [Anaerolineae bacterium]
MSALDDLRRGGVVILDYGSQYTQLIARRLREQQIYAEVLPHHAAWERIQQHAPRGIILSGGPSSVYEEGAPRLPRAVLESGLPVLGICYGLQLLAQAFGGQVSAAARREYGSAMLRQHGPSLLFDDLPASLEVWMSHGDHLESLPAGFIPLAESDNSPYAAIGHAERPLFGVQFHPEVRHTPQGSAILANFALRVCGCVPRWTPAAFVDGALESIRQQVGQERVLLGLSGGVDSAVTAALLNKAIGSQLTAVFVNTGLLRLGEPEEVVRVFRHEQGVNLVYHDASEYFLDALQGVYEPEAKRKIIGRLFVEAFQAEAARLSQAEGVRFLAQGTIYPDVIESAADSASAQVIKSHHNVGGLPADLGFELVEPLRDLFKDEVRRVGEALGLPHAIVWRQPFPGPGLAIRCLGDLTLERLDKLRQADAIFLAELAQAGMLTGETAQCFAVLLPVKSVGVMGDNRTYDEVIALRAVVSDDFMTADWARLPYELLARVSRRIVNEVRGVNRVVYDITSKPPATIEWE